MKYLNLIIILFAFTIFNSFDTAHTSINKDILGIWSYCYTKNGKTVYSKTDHLMYNKHMISFKAKDKFVTKRNVSDCGTPNIQYGKYFGNWHLNVDSTLTVNYSYNKTQVQQSWKIISISKDSLFLSY